MTLFVSIIILFVLLFVLKNRFPTDEELEERKNNKRKEICRILEFGTESEKRKLFKELYKDLDANEAYFSDKWIDYTGQFENFNGATPEWEDKFKEHIYPEFLKWSEDDVTKFVKKYFRSWIESKTNLNRILFALLILVDLIAIIMVLHGTIIHIIVSDGLFATVYTTIASFVPALILGLSLFIPIYILFIRKRLFESKYGKVILKNSEEYDITTRTYKIGYIFLVCCNIQSLQRLYDQLFGKALTSNFERSSGLWEIRLEPPYCWR